MLEASTIPRVFRETRRPKDEFTKLRWYVLARPVVYVVTFSPYVIRLFQVLGRPPLTHFAAITTVSVPLGLFVLAIFTYLSYKPLKEKE
jgi:hypothetical protein